MSPRGQRPLIYEHTSAQGDFFGDVLAGLRRPHKQLPCKYLYDRRGSRLFEAICNSSEYYLTRAELAIMERHIGEIAGCIGPDRLLVELGSGSCIKTRALLQHLPRCAGYVPVDICREQLRSSAEALGAAYPQLPLCPLWADFTAPFELPEPVREFPLRLVYFPGSTLGDLAPDEAQLLLGAIARLVGPGGQLLLGLDLKKDRATLERAYNDAGRLTAAFNLNLLRRINRELDGTFSLQRFGHWAYYREHLSRVEMHLVSLSGQRAEIGHAHAFTFAAGETVCTERSYKYSLLEFAALAASAGFEVQAVWTDPGRLFSVQYLKAVA